MKKGFTLIELLAVIVILAIIAIIAVPIVIHIIDDSKKSSEKESIDGYGRAAQLAISNYELKKKTYPNTFDELDIDYHGAKVECDTSRINPDYTIYLSKCKVNGKLVKDKKNKDGYYHYGTLKMTNQEYVDKYGNNLEDAIKKYYDDNHEYPNDYKILELEELDKEVSCDVTIQYDGSVYLENCKVNNKIVMDNDSIYIYGTIYATTELLKKANGIQIENYSFGNTHEMYTFKHNETEQTPALTDYRYIGSDPYNYVRFNEDEIWRIIGVFNTVDDSGNANNQIKLIKNEVLSESRSWNGSNSWKTAPINTYLNEDYYTLLSNNSKQMIQKSKFYLGGFSHYDITADAYYATERGLTVASGRDTNWTGLIGIMYPSDYLYCYALGVDDNCYNNGTSCGNFSKKSWLYNNSNSGLGIISTTSNNTMWVAGVSSNGNISGQNPWWQLKLKPTFYLKPNVKIKSGDGSIDSPYEFGL